jgi:hypoxanthine phosphoribosyltransferase
MNLERCTVLFDDSQIAQRIEEMAREIRADHQGMRITAICVLKGSFIFMADLVRAMAEHDIAVEFLGVSSYEGTQTTGAVKITQDLRASIEGKHVLLVEDIVDTGLTLRYLVDTLQLRGPASFKIATLLDKPARRRVEIQADYIGFTIPDHFVIGYGLDLDQSYRNLPYVAIYQPPSAD